MTRLTPPASSINGVVVAAAVAAVVVGGWGTGRCSFSPPTCFLFLAQQAAVVGKNQPGRVAADGLAGNWITERAEASVCAG